ncbi:MAG TPA: PIN domain-containing protein [Burkholderiales bacterium]|nr:PIN domain-containing protein [Burkholderiales bacterium]
MDTNILAYAEGLGGAPKCTAAVNLISQLQPEEVILPAQTLGELFRVLTGKQKISCADAEQAILMWADVFNIADSTWSAFQSAFDLIRDHRVSMWDGLIMSVAAEQGCRVLLSEDFNDGFTWRGVTVINPFNTGKPKLLAQILVGNNV